MDWNDSMNAADSTTASYPTASDVEASEVEQEGLPGKHVREYENVFIITERFTSNNRLHLF